MGKVANSLVLLVFLASCNTKPAYITPQVNSDDPAFNTQKREIISRTLGDAPNFAQTANGNFSAVVSRDFGRGAKAGAIIEFFYPLYARDHLWDAYNGIYYNGKLNWLHELKLTKQSIREDSGIIVSEFNSNDNKLRLKTQDVALRSNDTLVRNLEIVNTSSEELKELKLFFYEFFTINYAGAGDELKYDEKTGTLTHYEGDISFTIGSDKKPDQWQCGGAENFITSSYDARKDAEDGELRKNSSSSGRIGLGVNGSLGHTISLRPGEKFTINYFISAGKSFSDSQKNFQQSKTKTWRTIEQDELNFWKTWLDKARKPRVPDPRINRVYRRALITMKQNTANNGAVMAAPTLLSPFYAYTWPRDGSVAVSAYLEAGYRDEARKFLDFMSGLQKANGGWAVNFFMDGSRPLWDFGDRNNEHDQVGTMVASIFEYYQHTKDINWLEVKWPVVLKACDFLVNFNSDKDLMTASRDLWELHTDSSWTYTNAAAYGGLKAGAEIAAVLGKPKFQKTYAAVADRMKQAINDNLWVENGEYYMRGLNLDNGHRDLKVESANLGLSYPFEVFPYNDDKMNKMAGKIYSTLTSGNKGVRRYTNDRYYDGNPWPATTDWLAIFYSRQGNRTRAIELHNAVTNYAFSTDSLMLGEQFDEQQKLWVSAFPLTWSEAKYVLGTLEIYK